MIRRILQRFRKDDGTVALEFMLVFPVMATMIVLTIEMGLITLRQTMLERGLDMAVREVRLGTGTGLQHDDVKDMICENALFVQECNEKMFLEMEASDKRAFSSLHPIAVCTDRELPDDLRPARRFVSGQANQIVMLRACLKYDPIFPEALLGSMLHKDGEGEAAILAVSAFVQEPS